MARNFDGSSACLTIADHPALSFPDGDWTLAGWINTDELASGQQLYFYSHGQFAATPSCNMFVEAPLGRVYVAIKSDDGTFKFFGNPDVTITAGDWHHILLQNVGDDLRLHIDGIQRLNSNTAWNGMNPSSLLAIGRIGGYDDLYFDGCLAEWAKWDVALSDEQIAALVAGVRPPEVGTWPAWYLPMLGGLDEEIAGLAVTNHGTTVAEHPPRIVPQPGVGFGRT